MRYWLMKSEPTAYSIESLQRESKQTGCWDGVRNYQARNFMRDDMKAGDQVLFYHSNCKVPGIAGTAEVVREAYPDHTAFDPNEDHYDPKSSPDAPRWVMVDIRFKEQFDDVISLDSLRHNPRLKDMLILRKGNRLSITPVTKTEWNAVLKMK